MPLRVRLGLYIFLGALSLGFSVIIFPFFKTRLRLLKPPLPWLNGLKSCRQRQTRGPVRVVATLAVHRAPLLVRHRRPHLCTEELHALLLDQLGNLARRRVRRVALR